MTLQFQAGIVQNAWLWLIVAFFMGVLIEWLFEIYIYRRKVLRETDQALEQEKEKCRALAAGLQVELEQSQKSQNAAVQELQAQRETIHELESRLSLLLVPPVPLVAPLGIVGAGLVAGGLAAGRPDVEPVVGPHSETDRKGDEQKAERDEDDEKEYETACPQHLADVHGIGPVFEQRLYGAGIGTFWELYKAPFEQLYRILEIKGIQEESVDPKHIRADALRLAKESASKGRRWSGAAPDDFELLKGIGFTYEKRLYDAGICTYTALAQATPEQLEAICGKGMITHPDFENWIKQAQVLQLRKLESAAKNIVTKNPID